MTEPYYADDRATLYLGRMEDVPEWLSADIMVTDPPYGMRYQSNSAIAGPSEPIIGDETTELRDAAIGLWGTTKPSLVFGTWRARRPDVTRQLVIWDKGMTPGMGDLSLPWGPSHEEVYVIGGYGREHWAGSRGPSVIRSKNRQGNATGRVGHPTPKPIYLMQALLSKINPAYLIADPFAGSGSTLVAAKMLDRRSVGVELEERYAEQAARRLEKIR